jgi:hypothetical protein
MKPGQSSLSPPIDKTRIIFLAPHLHNKLGWKRSGKFLGEKGGNIMRNFTFSTVAAIALALACAVQKADAAPAAGGQYVVYQQPPVTYYNAPTYTAPTYTYYQPGNVYYPSTSYYYPPTTYYPTTTYYPNYGNGVSFYYGGGWYAPRQVWYGGAWGGNRWR